MRLYRGRAAGVRADDRDRLLLRFRAATAALRGGLSRDRGRDGRRSSAEDRAVRADRCAARRGAASFCAELGQALKVEHIETGLADQATVSFYRQGRVHRSLPRAAHSQHRAHRQGVQAADRRRRLLEGRRLAASSCSGSTPPRSSTRRNSTTICTQLEEAKRRDHRVLGKQLELFTISQTVGSGLILWLPKGAIIRQTLEDFLKGELRQARLRAGLHAEHRQDRAVPDLGPLSVLQRQPVPADRSERCAKGRSRARASGTCSSR